ncbi:chorismate-binding protein [Mariniflexile sp.]|uniref:chorismate-binding protein n=1 Tax=Mariniflexile sp. TaxID=1979402 RepID=UPI0035614444
MTFDDFFARIETQYNAQLPFVAYRKPRETQVNGLLQQTKQLHVVNDFTEKGFVFAPFDDEAPSVLIPMNVSKGLSANIPLEGEKVSQMLSSEISLEDKRLHIKLVDKGIDAIKKSEFEKVVLSREETVNLSEASPFSIFINLLNTYPQAFVYCWYHPKIGLWLGATPETLIKIGGNQFSIMALAGTQVYKDTLKVNWGTKEYEEQQYVTDFIVNSLKPLVDSFKVSNTETVKAGNLLHLKTMISASLKASSNLKTLISAIHPTPAVCGLPKLKAKQFILENENYNRAFYTGYLGELNMETIVKPRSGRRNIENRAYTITKNNTQLYVNLRCMQLVEKTAIIYVGGGITAGSESDKEWEETVSKSLIIKNIL